MRSAKTPSNLNGAASPCIWLVALAILLSGCGLLEPPATHPARPAPTKTAASSPAAADLSGGILAYAGERGIGLLDPTDGRSRLLVTAPRQQQAYMVSPSWISWPGSSRPSLIFSAGTNHHNGWLFRADPFAGTVRPVFVRYFGPANGLFDSPTPTDGGYLAYYTAGCNPGMGGPLTVIPLTGGPRRTYGNDLSVAGAAPGGRLVVFPWNNFVTGPWVWLDPRTGTQESFPFLPRAITDKAYGLSFTADGREAAFLIAHNHRRNRVGLLNLGTGKWRLLPLPPSLPGDPFTLTLSPAGRRLVVVAARAGSAGNGYGNGRLYLWDLPTGAVYPLLSGQTVSAVSWSPPLPGQRFSALKPLPVLPLIHLRLAVTGYRTAMAKGGAVRLTATVKDARSRPVAGLPVLFAYYSCGPDSCNTVDVGTSVTVPTGTATLSMTLTSSAVQPPFIAQAAPPGFSLRGEVVALAQWMPSPNGGTP